jgi:Flp pilus assembly protein TadG
LAISENSCLARIPTAANLASSKHVEIRPPWSARLRSENAASSVEFALIASLLFAIIFATIEFAIWSVYQTVIAGAARDSAIEYSLTQSADQAMKKAYSSSAELSPDLVAANIQIFVNGSSTPLALTYGTGGVLISDPGCTPGEQIRVKISYQHNLVTGALVESFLGSENLGINAESVTVCG